MPDLLHSRGIAGFPGPESKMNMHGETHGDDCEVVVLEHPLANSSQKHIHHGREVICKKTADSITLEPQAKQKSEDHVIDNRQITMVGHDKQYTYKRTEDVNVCGQPIFREETSPVA